jgi:hypothetical protein
MTNFKVEIFFKAPFNASLSAMKAFRLKEKPSRAFQGPLQT